MALPYRGASAAGDSPLPLARLPILADAQQNACCDGANVLDHCRHPGDYVRGCWVVALVSGKG
jgi:hypothetical protein